MGGLVEVSSPIDLLRLRAELDTATRVQFQAPLSEADYRTLAAILAEHPSVTLRAYGFDAADVEFLDLGETRKPLDLTRPPHSGTCASSGSHRIAAASRAYSTPTPTCRASHCGDSRSTRSS
ncbi:hypothetical protein [Micromonospora sp. DT47]|uniref:hypothetical protein n=1 Tax=Micromonospora sp. DT47 TaxID=3393431 RepID=UPI003CFB8D04